MKEMKILYAIGEVVLFTERITAIPKAEQMTTAAFGLRL